MSDQKPIDKALTDLKQIKQDVNDIKSDLVHIKKYIRSLEVKKQLEKEEAQKQENEYVIEKKGWWFY
tara:strand:+ start:59 stop:259 length:201 start_codon:yes stop_codon:yes gene_type:complete